MPSQLIPTRAGVTPFSFPPRSLLTRFSLYLKLSFVKALVAFLVGLERRFKPKPASTKPTLIRSWDSRPALQNRVFYPPGYDSSKKEKLGLYLDIHGGGYVLFDPQADDTFCSQLARKTGLLVISLDYAKCPAVHFPSPYEDILATTLSILSDSTLPIDVSRVAMGGFSAGAQLSLSVSASPELKGKIITCVNVYGVNNSSVDLATKMATRPKTDVPDVLEVPGPLFDYAHVPEGQNRRDPRLSPFFAKTEDLPKSIFFIGAELDCLAHEALVMAESVAPSSSSRTPYSSPSSVMSGWDQGSIRWALVKDQVHHYTHAPEKRAKEFEERRVKAVDETFDEISVWLKDAGVAR